MMTMPTMPTMPNSSKNKPSRECACGCKGLTKGTWVSGHDGRATGWALRVIRGIMTAEEVPANERKGCELMMRRLRAKAKAARGERKVTPEVEQVREEQAS